MRPEPAAGLDILPASKFLHTRQKGAVAVTSRFGESHPLHAIAKFVQLRATSQVPFSNDFAVISEISDLGEFEIPSRDLFSIVRVRRNYTQFQMRGDDFWSNYQASQRVEYVARVCDGYRDFEFTVSGPRTLLDTAHPPESAPIISEHAFCLRMFLK